MDELIDAIKKALERKGISAAAASEMAVGNPSAIKNLMKRRGSERNHPIENLIAVAKVLGLELYLGPPRSTADQSRLKEFSKSRDVESLLEFSLVPRFDVNLSAGPGAASDNAKPLAPVAFRNDWLMDRGLRADRCVVCTATGYSMEPLLFDGDLVLLDRTEGAVRDGQVYGVVDLEGDTRIKRIEKVSGGIVLRSDNPESATEARMGEDANRVRIVGRLVWSGHSHDAIKQTPARQTQRRSTFKHEWI